jgi:hypothetical protein
MGDFELAAELAALSLDAEVYTAYVEGIMDEEDTPLDERVESVLGILGSATDEQEKLAAFGEGLGRYWEQIKKEEAAAKAAGPSAEKQKEVRAFQARLEAEKAAAEAELKRQAEELQQRCTQDRTEARSREALLAKYGVETDAVDEEGNFVGGSSGGGDADLALGAMLGANANKAQVQEAAQRQREQAKAAHAQKVLRDKMALVKQKQEAEKKKERTQKREKQRGRG